MYPHLPQLQLFAHTSQCCTADNMYSTCVIHVFTTYTRTYLGCACLRTRVSAAPLTTRLAVNVPVKKRETMSLPSVGLTSLARYAYLCWRTILLLWQSNEARFCSLFVRGMNTIIYNIWSIEQLFLTPYHYLLQLLKTLALFWFASDYGEKVGYHTSTLAVIYVLPREGICYWCLVAESWTSYTRIWNGRKVGKCFLNRLF